MENVRENQNEWPSENEKNASIISDSGDFPTQRYFASDDDDDDDDDEIEDTDEQETDDANADWGNVDPLSHPGPPSDMDPSAPGSAV